MAGGRLTEGAGDGEARLIDGVRAGVPFALAGFLLAMSFGVVAQQAGLPAPEAILMSPCWSTRARRSSRPWRYSPRAEGLVPPSAAATLMNSRFLAMGAALGPSLPGGPRKRAAQGQTVVDASWALAAARRRHLRPLDAVRRERPCSSSPGRRARSWARSAADLIVRPGAARARRPLFPAFFLALLMGGGRTSRARGGRALGGLIALALVPIAPAGVPVLVAGLAAALVGLHALGPRSTRPGRPCVSTSVAIVIAGCAITTAAVKAIGPIALGGRDLPAWFSSVVVLLAPALLAALVDDPGAGRRDRAGGRAPRPPASRPGASSPGQPNRSSAASCWRRR